MWPLSSLRPNRRGLRPKGRWSLILRCDHMHIKSLGSQVQHLRSPKSRCSPLPLLVPVGRDVLPCLWIRSGQVMTILGRGLPHPLVSDLEASGCDWIDCGPLVFGMLTLLKHKADDIAAGPVPPLPQSSLPPQPSPPPQSPNTLATIGSSSVRCTGCSGWGHGGWTLCAGLRL